MEARIACKPKKDETNMPECSKKSSQSGRWFLEPFVPLGRLGCILAAIWTPGSKGAPEMRQNDPRTNRKGSWRSKVERNGTQRHQKVNWRLPKRNFRSQKRTKRKPKGSQGSQTAPKGSQRASKMDAKICQKYMQTTIPPKHGDLWIADAKK